jgi:hypothetical protein
MAVMGLAWLLLPGIALRTVFIDYRLPWAISFFLLSGIVARPRYAMAARSVLCFFCCSGHGAGRHDRRSIGDLGANAGSHRQQSRPLAAWGAAMILERDPPGGGVFRRLTLTNTHVYVMARWQVVDPGMFANMPGQLLYFQQHHRDLWLQDNWGESAKALVRPAGGL